MSNDDPGNYDTEEIVLTNKELIDDLKKKHETGAKGFDDIMLGCSKREICDLQGILAKEEGHAVEEILDGYLIAYKLSLYDDSSTLKIFFDKLNIFSYEELVAHYRNHEKHQHFLHSLLIKKYIEDPFNIKVSSSLGKTIVPKKLKTAYCIEMLPFISLVKFVSVFFIKIKERSGSSTISTKYKEWFEKYFEHKIYTNYLGINNFVVAKNDEIIVTTLGSVEFYNF